MSAAPREMLAGAELGAGRLPDLADLNEARASDSAHVVWLISVFLALFFGWAWFFEIDEVSSGAGKVIPSSREQVIQSLEGGILSKLNVREGQIVEKGQVLAQLDLTRSESSVEESAARYRAALAASARLQAEVNGKPAIDFPVELDNWPQLKASEMALFQSHNASLNETVNGLTQALGLIRRELDITQSLMSSGAASSVELIRLQRQEAELKLKIGEALSLIHI